MAVTWNPKLADLYEGSPSTLRVALCQVYTEDWAIEENTARTLEALEEAGRQGAELAITPECVLHGYCYDDIGNDDFRGRMLEIAERQDGPTIAAFRDKAKSLGMDVVFGFAERGEGDNVHNSAAFISRDGDIPAVYRKVHCRSFESSLHGRIFTPGNEFSVIERTYGDRAFKIGLMICFDRELPESVRSLRSLGAEFIACPLATTTCDMTKYVDYADNEVITRTRAAENEVFIAVVNHAGRYLKGGSFVVGPGGERLCQMGPDAGVHVLDVPVGLIGEKFHSNPIGWMGWGYRRPEVYDKYLSSDDNE